MHTYSQFRVPVHITRMVLDGGRKQENPERPHADAGRTYSTQKGPSTLSCFFLLNVLVAQYIGVQDAQLPCLCLHYLRVPLLLQGQFDVEEASGLQLHTQLLTATPWNTKPSCKHSGHVKTEAGPRERCSVGAPLNSGGMETRPRQHTRFLVTPAAVWSGSTVALGTADIRDLLFHCA